jgi:hypothetical protein
MVWYGMVWYGMVWYGMVWYGMVDFQKSRDWRDRVPMDNDLTCDYHLLVDHWGLAQRL